MKNYLLQLMFVFATISTFSTLTACTEDETDDYLMSDAIHFNPPGWIQGKWSANLDDNSYFYEFESGDFINKIQNTTQSYNYFINASQMSPSPSERFVLVEEIKTSSRYKFQIKSPSITLSYDFEKLNDTLMIDKNNPVLDSLVKYPK